jgi:hypothetical protein
MSSGRIIVIAFFAALLLSVAACNDSGGSSPNVNRYAYELTSDDGTETSFLLGREGITDSLPEIEAGQTLSQKWTLVTVPHSLVAPDATQASIDLSTPGIAVTHEWDGDDPMQDGYNIRWVRLDAVTGPSTSGLLTIDRSDGPENGIVVLFTWEGEIDLYGTGEASYHRLELETGMSFFQP